MPRHSDTHLRILLNHFSDRQVPLNVHEVVIRGEQITWEGHQSIIEVDLTEEREPHDLSIGRLPSVTRVNMSEMDLAGNDCPAYNAMLRGEKVACARTGRITDDNLAHEADPTKVRTKNELVPGSPHEDELTQQQVVSGGDFILRRSEDGMPEAEEPIGRADSMPVNEDLPGCFMSVPVVKVELPCVQGDNSEVLPVTAPIVKNEVNNAEAMQMVLEVETAEQADRRPEEQPATSSTRRGEAAELSRHELRRPFKQEKRMLEQVRSSHRLCSFLDEAHKSNVP